MIVILTKKPKEGVIDIKYFLNSFRYFLKRNIQGIRGPQEVINNLLDGLDGLGEKYLLDPDSKLIEPNARICVIRDLQALEFAIRFKNKNIKTKIFAGPNIITTPDDQGSIIFDERINKIIVPSPWVKDFYKEFNINGPDIEVWPVGIKIPNISSDKSGKGIIYKKNVPIDVSVKVMEELDNKKIDYQIIEYGNFNQKDYFKLLSKAPWMIYLQTSESQGLSMFEAWSYNVPTLVWNNNKYYYNDKEYYFEKLSSPFLSHGSGMFFDTKEFENTFDSFVENLNNFQPKEYIENNFSTKLAARKFLDIIKE